MFSSPYYSGAPPTQMRDLVYSSYYRLKTTVPCTSINRACSQCEWILGKEKGRERGRRNMYDSKQSELNTASGIKVLSLLPSFPPSLPPSPLPQHSASRHWRCGSPSSLCCRSGRPGHSSARGRPGLQTDASGTPGNWRSSCERWEEEKGRGGGEGWRREEGWREVVSDTIKCMYMTQLHVHCYE